MDFNIVSIFNRAVTIELNNEDIYKSNEPASVYLDGTFVCKADTNVISIHFLEPDTEYDLAVLGCGSTADEDDSANCLFEVSEKSEDAVHHTFRTKHEFTLLDVTRFGAKGDGVTYDTSAIQAAIYSCPENGTVRIPRGTFFTTSLFLKSSTTLLLEKGARLLFDPNREHYPVLPGITRNTDDSGEYNLATWEGNPLDSFAGLITGIDVENVDIIGEGIIDGNAENGDWWKECKKKRTAWRPNLVFLCRCNNVRMQGVSLMNSPCWTVHPYYSDHLQFLNLTISNPSDSPNTDGFDPESCEDILLLGTRMSVGDDCVAIKSGKYYMSMYHFKRTKQIVIRNCLFEKGHGSVTIGSEIAGGVENVLVERCIFRGTDRGVRIKTRRGRGKLSLVKNISFKNITMENVHMPMTVNMFYFCDSDGHSDYVQSQEKMPVDELTPVLGDISLSGISCSGVTASIVCAFGLPEMPVERISITNLTASFVPSSQREPEQTMMMDNFDAITGCSFYVRNVDCFILKDVTVSGSDDAAPTVIGVKKRIIENLRYE